MNQQISLKAFYAHSEVASFGTVGQGSLARLIVGEQIAGQGTPSAPLAIATLTMPRAGLIHTCFQSFFSI